MSGLMVRQWAGKTGDIVYAKVMGSGEFPLDMLRYDGCSPATEEDSNLIRRTISQPYGNWSYREESKDGQLHTVVDCHNWVIMIQKVLRERVKPTDNLFTIGRWNSFGCAINETDNHRLDRSPWSSVRIDSANASLFSRFVR